MRRGTAAGWAAGILAALGIAAAAAGQDAETIRREIEALDRKRAELQRRLEETERRGADAGGRPAPTSPGTPPGGVSAPGGTGSGETLLDAVEVVATRFPRARGASPLPITVIDGAWFEQHQESSVADALRQVPGVSVARGGANGAATSVFVRGALSNQVLVLEDGIPLNDPTLGGQFNFFDFDALEVERVEVLRGSYGALYGSSAIGGVVSVTTRRGRGPGAFRVSAEGGSFGTDREVLRGSGGDDAADWAFGLARTRADGFRDREEFRSTSFAGKFGARVAGDGRLEFALRSIDSVAEDPFDFGNPLPLDENVSRERELLAGGLAFEKPLSRSVTARVRASLTDIDSAFRNLADAPGGASEFISTNEATTVSTGAAVRAVLAEGAGGGRGLEVVAGFDFQKEESLGFSHSPFGKGLGLDRATNDRAFYGLLSATWGAATLSGGGRHDDHSEGGGTWSPQAGAQVRVEGTGSTLRANYGQGFRSPTPIEFADPFVGNPGLGPETSRSFDAGVVQRLGRGVEAELSWFHLRTTDLIAFSGTSFRLENVARARTIGTEFSLRATLADGLAARASWTHQRPRDAVTGDRLANRPEDFGSLGAEWVSGRWVLAGDVSFSGAADDLGFAGPDAGLRRRPGRKVLADLAVRWKVADSLSILARVENVLNDAYVETPTSPRAQPLGAFLGIAVDF